MTAKKLYLFISIALFFAFSAANLNAQTARKAVSAAEVTGTFRYNFTGKFKGNSNEIKILALGRGKLRVSFDLTYPFVDGTGALSANVGQAEGIAEIKGDTAVFTNTEYGDCRIRIKFVRAGEIRVEQLGELSACGFGFNVSAGGTYKKVSGAKPKFEQ